MVRLSVPAQLCFRDLALSSIFAAIDAEGHCPDTNVRDEITSAVNEAFNNVVLHAYRGVRGGTIDLQVVAQVDHVEITITDRGRGYDPDEVPSYRAPQMLVPDAAPREADAPASEEHTIDTSIQRETPAIDALKGIDFGQLPESGMGLYIMRSFMDEVIYTRGGGGRPNVLVLRKAWDATPAAAAGSQAEPSKKETSQSGWRIRSVAVPAEGQSIAGSLKRK